MRTDEGTLEKLIQPKNAQSQKCHLDTFQPFCVSIFIQIISTETHNTAHLEKFWNNSSFKSNVLDFYINFKIVRVMKKISFQLRMYIRIHVNLQRVRNESNVAKLTFIGLLIYGNNTTPWWSPLKQMKKSQLWPSYKLEWACNWGVNP